MQLTHTDPSCVMFEFLFPSRCIHTVSSQTERLKLSAPQTKLFPCPIIMVHSTSRWFGEWNENENDEWHTMQTQYSKILVTFTFLQIYVKKNVFYTRYSSIVFIKNNFNFTFLICNCINSAVEYETFIAFKGINRSL